MPPKQPSYLDLLSPIGDMYKDPSFFVPTGGAAIVGGIDQARKAIQNPGAFKDQFKLGGTVVKKAVQQPLRTGLPFIDDALDSAKATYDHVVPRFMNKTVEPIAAPIRTAMKPITNAVAAVSKTPVVKALGTGAKAIGKGIGFIDRTLMTGAGGKAHRILDALTLSSPTGDLHYEDAINKQGAHIDNILRTYRSMTTPAMLGSEGMTPEGQRKFRLGLMNLHQNLINAGVPQQVYDHVMASVKNPGQLQNSDFNSLRDILIRHVPLNQKYDDPTFAGGGGVSGSDLANTLTFNLPELAAVLSGGSSLDHWKTSTQRGSEAIGRYGEMKQQEYLTKINASFSQKQAEIENLVRAGRMKPEAAKKLNDDNLKFYQSLFNNFMESQRRLGY